MNFFEMFEKSMKVVELEVATGVVTALLMKSMRDDDHKRRKESIRVRLLVRKRLQHSRLSRPLEFFR